MWLAGCRASGARWLPRRQGAGGGEDVIMFRTLLERKARVRYRPEMVVLHAVESWRLSRRYFLKLHYLAGIRKRHDQPTYERTIFGVPPFMLAQLFQHTVRSAIMYATNRPGKLRQAMNATHALGLIRGMLARKAEMETKL